MQPLLVSKNPVVADLDSVQRCCINADWNRVAFQTTEGALFSSGFSAPTLSSSSAAAAAATSAPAASNDTSSAAPILLSETTEPPVAVELLSRNKTVTDFAWCSKDPVLYAVGDDGMTLYCYNFEGQQQQQQQQQEQKPNDEFAISSSSAAAAAATTWAAAIPAEIVEAACLSSNAASGASRDEPTPVSSDAAAPALANMSFGSDRRIVGLRTDPARVGIWVHLRSLLVSLQFVYRRPAAAAATVATGKSSSGKEGQVAEDSSDNTSSSSSSSCGLKLHIIASRRVPLRNSTIPPRWCAGPTSVVTLDFDTSELIVWDISGTAAVVLSHIPVNVPTADAKHISLHFGGDRVDTIIIFNGASNQPISATKVGAAGTTTATSSSSSLSSSATATWLDLSHEEQRHSMRSRSRCSRPSRFDVASLAAHDPAALLLQPVMESNKFTSWNSFKSRFDPSLRQMFGSALSLVDDDSGHAADDNHHDAAAAAAEDTTTKTTTSQLLELHTFDTPKNGMCVFALLKLKRSASAADNNDNSTNRALSAASFLAVVVSARDNAKIDEVAFQLPSVPVEHTGPFVGTASASQINNLYLCAPILSTHGVAAIALEAASGSNNYQQLQQQQQQQQAAASSSFDAAGDDADGSGRGHQNSLNALIQRFAHRAAGATRVLCRINEWDDASVRDATIALAAQNGAVALASELFGLLESDEDLASAVAACSTLHKLFATRYRELDVDDTAAREPFENLVVTAIRFAEQLLLKLFAHQQQFLARQQQQQSSSSSSSSPPPSTRLFLRSITEVRHVVEACKSDDLVLFAASSQHSNGSDATSLVASLLEGWCRMLETLRSSTASHHGGKKQQPPPFADALVSRVGKELRTTTTSNNNNSQQQLAMSKTSVEIVRKALELVQRGRMSAAVQFMRQLPSSSSSSLIPAMALSNNSFSQVRAFVYSVACHVLSDVGNNNNNNNNNGSSSSFGPCDFATTVACIAKCLPKPAARDEWFRAAMWSTDSFVVRNRILELAPPSVRASLNSSSSSSASTAAFQSPLFLQLIETAHSLLGVDSKSLRALTDFGVQRAKMMTEVMATCLPRTSWAPVLFRAIEKKTYSKSGGGIATCDDGDSSSLAVTRPRAVAGVVSSFPLRVLEAVSSSGGAESGAADLEAQFLAASIERAVFDVVTVASSNNSTSLETALSAVLSSSPSVGAFARAALRFATAHLDFSVAVAAGNLVRSQQQQQQQQQQQFTFDTSLVLHEEVLSNPKNRLVCACFLAAAGAEPQLAKRFSVHPAATLLSAAPPSCSQLAASLLGLMQAVGGDGDDDGDSREEFLCALTLLADSATSPSAAWQDVADVVAASNKNSVAQELAQLFADQKLLRDGIPGASSAGFLAVCDAVLRLRGGAEETRTTLQRILAEFAAAAQAEPRGSALRPHSVALADCCVTTHSRSRGGRGGINNDSSDDEEAAEQRRQGSARAVFRAVTTTTSSSAEEGDGADDDDEDAVGKINAVVDAFVAGDFDTVAKSGAVLSESCVQLLGPDGAPVAASMLQQQASLDESSSSVSPLRQRTEGPPRWIVLLRQQRILAAAEEAKKASISIEECLNACQEIFMAPAQQEQQQQQQQTKPSAQEEEEEALPLLTKLELAEAHTLMFLVHLGFTEYAQSIYRSFQMAREDSSSSNNNNNNNAGGIDRVSGIAPWLCIVCSDAEVDDQEEEENAATEQRARFRADAKQQRWPRLLQHAFAARLSPRFLFELLAAAPSLQAAVFAEKTLRAAATDGTSWGRKICVKVNTRAFIRDMGAEQLPAASTPEQQCGLAFARCILLALNASRATDQIDTQLETFLTTTSTAFSNGSGSTCFQLSTVLSVLIKLFVLPAAVVYRVLSDIAHNLQLPTAEAAAAATSSQQQQQQQQQVFLFTTLWHICVFLKHTVDEQYDAAAVFAAQNVSEDDVLDLTAEHGAVADLVRVCISRLAGGGSTTTTATASADQTATTTHTGALRCAAAIFRAFPNSIGERVYKSPHGAADAIVALDDAVTETLEALAGDDASQQRDRSAVPRLERLLAVVSRDLNRHAAEAHLPTEFTSKVWAACDDPGSTAASSQTSTAAAAGAASAAAAPSSAAASSGLLHVAAGVSSRSQQQQQQHRASSSSLPAGARRFRSSAEVWRHFREAFVDAALGPGSPWSSENERGFFVQQIFQDWVTRSSAEAQQQQQQQQSSPSNNQPLRFFADDASDLDSDEQLLAMLHSETTPPLSDVVFRKTSQDNVAGLLIWLVAFSVPPGDLTADVLLRLVSLRLSSIRAKTQQQRATTSGGATSGLAGSSSSSSSSLAAGGGTALAEQRLRHIHTVVSALRHQMSERLLHYILNASLCTEVLELEVEGHLLRLQRDACPTFDDVISGEKPVLDHTTVQLLLDSGAQTNNFFFKQWVSRMFSVPRDALAKFGAAAATTSKKSNNKSGGTPVQSVDLDASDSSGASAELARMLSPFVGEERAREDCRASTMTVSNASNILRDVLATPCASWSDSVLPTTSSSNNNNAASSSSSPAPPSLSTAEESRHLLREKIRVASAVLAALEEATISRAEAAAATAVATASSSLAATAQDAVVAAAGSQPAQQQQQEQEQQQQQLLTEQQHSTMLNLIAKGIFAAWIVPLLGYRGSNGDDASRISIWASRNLNVLSESYHSATEHFGAASEQFRVQAASLHWTHEASALAQLVMSLRKSRPRTFPSLTAVVNKLFDLLARTEDALAGAVDDGCFAEAKLFLAAVGWRLVNESAATTTTTTIATNTVSIWDPVLITKVLDEADASLNVLANRSDLAPIGRFALAVDDAPWMLTPLMQHLLQVVDYDPTFIAPLAVAAQMAPPTTRALTSSCTRLALLHYFLAAADFAVEVCGTADMYSFFGHNAPLAEGFEFEAWSMLLSLTEMQKKKPSSNREADVRRLEKLLDEVTASFEQSAEAFFRADLYDRAFSCVQVVRLLDAQLRESRVCCIGGSSSAQATAAAAAAGVGGVVSKITEAALAGMSESMAQTLIDQGVALPPGCAGGTSTPEVQRRQAAATAAGVVTDPLSVLLLGCGAEFNLDEWAHALQRFVVTAASMPSSKVAAAAAASSTSAAAAAGGGLGRVMELGRQYKNACITVGPELPARMRALSSSMQAGTQRTAWEELISVLEVRD